MLIEDDEGFRRSGIDFSASLDLPTEFGVLIPYPDGVLELCLDHRVLRDVDRVEDLSHTCQFATPAAPISKMCVSRVGQQGIPSSEGRPMKDQRLVDRRVVKTINWRHIILTCRHRRHILRTCRKKHVWETY